MTAGFPSLALVRRELMSTLRGWRAFGVFFVFAAIATARTLAQWPRNTTDRTGILYEIAGLVDEFMYIMAIGTVVCVPAFAAGAIVLERERGTFDLLRMTLARPAGVVASKLMNAVGFFFLLTVGLAPIVATGFFLPGLDRAQLFAEFIVIASMAVSCAAVGIMCSTMFRRSLMAIAMSYVGVAAIWVLPMILLFLVFAAAALILDVRSVGGEIESVWSVVMPLVQLANVQARGVTDTLIPAVAYQVLAACACSFVAHRRLLKPMNPPKVELRKPVDDAKVLRERRTTWPYYLVDPLRRKKPIEDGRNPMLVREVRWGLVNRGSILIRLFYISVTIYFFVGVLAFTSNARDYATMWAWFSTQCILTIVVAPALTANTVTKELELGNLDMLRITLLRPHDIVTGKFLAAVFSLLPMLLAALISVVPVGILVRPDWRLVAMGFGTLVICASLSLSVAIFFSTALHRTLPAIVASYLASTLVFFLSTPLARWAVTASEYWNVPTPRGRLLPPWETIELFAWASPYRTLDVSLDHFESQGAFVAFRFWIVGSGAWFLAALALLGVSVWLFSRNRMRDA